MLNFSSWRYSNRTNICAWSYWLFFLIHKKGLIIILSSLQQTPPITMLGSLPSSPIDFLHPEYPDVITETLVQTVCNVRFPPPADTKKNLTKLSYLLHQNLFTSRICTDHNIMREGNVVNCVCLVRRVSNVTKHGPVQSYLLGNRPLPGPPPLST